MSKSAAKFSWAQAHKKIATVLLEYEDCQDELCSIVEENRGKLGTNDPDERSFAQSGA